MNEQIILGSTRHTAWLVGNGDWTTSWTGPSRYTSAQAHEMVRYAALLESTGPRTDLTGDELEALAFAWADRLDCPADDALAELQQGHVTIIAERGSRPLLRGEETIDVQ